MCTVTCHTSIVKFIVEWWDTELRTEHNLLMSWAYVCKVVLPSCEKSSAQVLPSCEKSSAQHMEKKDYTILKLNAVCVIIYKVPCLQKKTLRPYHCNDHVCCTTLAGFNNRFTHISAYSFLALKSSLEPTSNDNCSSTWLISPVLSYGNDQGLITSMVTFTRVQIFIACQKRNS